MSDPHVHFHDHGGARHAHRHTHADRDAAHAHSSKLGGPPVKLELLDDAASEPDADRARYPDERYVDEGRPI